MLRFLRAVTLPLALLLVLLISASVAVGGLHRPHPASTQLAWCDDELICWLGINTAHTLIADVPTILTAAGYQSAPEEPNVYRSDRCLARVMPVSTSPMLIGALGVQCDELRVSEVMSAIGVPDRVGFTCDGNYIFYYGRNLIMNIGGRLSPNQRVELMALSNVLSNPYRQRWYGFALPWMYRDRFC